MNVLAIGAHPDDIEILCGGTLALYAEEGHSIFTAVATDGSVGTPDLTKAEISAIRRQEQEASAALLGATLIWMGFEDEWLFNDRPTRTAFLDAIRQADPDIMFVHSPNDYIADHRVASQIATDCRIPASVRLVETALPACSKIPHVFFMDNVAGIDFSPEHYVDISSVLPRKAGNASLPQEPGNLDAAGLWRKPVRYYATKCEASRPRHQCRSRRSIPLSQNLPGHSRRRPAARQSAMTYQVA